jgi:hypothetical protein
MAATTKVQFGPQAALEVLRQRPFDPLELPFDSLMGYGADLVLLRSVLEVDPGMHQRSQKVLDVLRRIAVCVAQTAQRTDNDSPVRVNHRSGDIVSDLRIISSVLAKDMNSTPTNTRVTVVKKRPHGFDSRSTKRLLATEQHF